MKRLTTNLGVRADYFNAIKNKFYFSPRFSASYMLTPITNLNFSTGIYYQTPSYIWLIADEKNRELKNVRVEPIM